MIGFGISLPALVVRGAPRVINLVPDSEDFDGSGYGAVAAQCVFTEGQAGPFGENNATNLLNGGGTAGWWALTTVNIALANEAPYTASMYLKAGTGTQPTEIRVANITHSATHSMQLSWSAGVPSAGNLTNAQDGGVQTIGSDWYRISVVMDLAEYPDEVGDNFQLRTFPWGGLTDGAANCYTFGWQIDKGLGLPGSYKATP